jgi:hypothetical protein
LTSSILPPGFEDPDINQPKHDAPAGNYPCLSRSILGGRLAFGSERATWMKMKDSSGKKMKRSKNFKILI